MSKLKKILQLFIAFFKIGLFTFGGGYAMIAVIERELIEQKKWLTQDEFLDVVAIAESTPGPIAINSATFIGYKVAGVLGSLFATLGVVLPSFIIIFAISFVFDKFIQIKWVAYAFKGIQACVAFIILNAGIKMFVKIKKNVFNVTLFAISVVCLIVLELLAKNFSSIFYILIGGILGVIVYLIGYIKGKKSPKNDKGGKE